MAAAKPKIKDDDPLQDFMNDVFKTARRAVRDVRRREKKEELRKAADQRREAEAVTAKYKRERAMKKVASKANRNSTTSSNEDLSIIDSSLEEPSEPSPDAWKEDVVKLKESLATFDVSSDGLRVTWHGTDGRSTTPGEGSSNFPKIASKSVGSVGASPGKQHNLGGLPAIGGSSGNQGGLGALAAAGQAAALLAAQNRKRELGFNCHQKYDASPLFTEEGKKALAKKAGSRTTARDESGKMEGQLGGSHAYHGGGGMVSATDGLKQAILSGKIVSADGTIIQDLVAELQGPTSWSGLDLGIKYRSEFEREAAWAAYVKATKASESVHASQGSYFTTATVARHELFVALDKSLCDENEQSLMRARLRGTKRRFAMDLHQIWLTNLEHIREHRLGGLPQHSNHGDGADRVEDARKNTVTRRHDSDSEDEEELAVLMRPPPDRGLPNRRDTESIINISSQIASVAPERTWASVPQPLSMGHIKKNDKSRSFKRSPTASLITLPLPPPGYRRILSNEEWKVEGKEGSRLLLVTIERMAMSDDAEAMAVSHEGGKQASPGLASLVRPPLWRVTTYDRRDGSQGRVVIKENDARRAVAKAEKLALKQLPSAQSSSNPFDWANPTPTLYRQAIRCRSGNVRRSFLVQLALTQCRPATPVYVLLRILPLKLNKTKVPTPWTSASFSVTEVKARLGLMGLPTSDLAWWKDLNNVTVKEWTRIIRHLTISQVDNGKIELSLTGSDQPLDDVLGVPDFDAEVCNDALKLLPLLRWESLSEEETKAREEKAKKEETARLARGERSHCCPQGTEFRLTALVEEPSPERDAQIAAEVEAKAAAGITDMRDDWVGPWEDKVEWDPTKMPLSMLCSGLNHRMDLVPGCSVVPGALHNPGLWFRYEPSLEGGGLPVPETTYAIGNYFRQLGSPNGPLGVNWREGGAAARFAELERGNDGRYTRGLGVPSLEEDEEARAARLDSIGKGAANSVVVNMLLALDTPLLVPPLVAWVHQCLNAKPVGDEPIFGVIPFSVNSPRMMRACPLESSLDARVSEPCAILTAAEEPEDYAIDPASASSPSASSVASRSSTATTNKSQAVCGHRRRWHWRHTKSGMRHLVEFPLLFPDSVVDAKFFGLTQRGALPNAPRCGTGHRWMSTEGCRKSLTRVRSASDYNKLAKASGHQGASDPGLFTCHLRGVPDVLTMDEVVNFVESHKLSIDLRDGQTTVDQLRTMTLEGARARGWPEGDAGRLLTKVSMIRERTARETSWHVNLYKVALGGLKAFMAWHEVMEATKQAQLDAKRKKERIDAARRIIEAREQLAKDKANEEIRLQFFNSTNKEKVPKIDHLSLENQVASAGAGVWEPPPIPPTALATALNQPGSSNEEEVLIKELASDKRLLRVLANQLGLPSAIVDELELAAEEEELAHKVVQREGEEAALAVKSRSVRGDGVGIGDLVSDVNELRHPAAIKQDKKNPLADMPLLKDLLEDEDRDESGGDGSGGGSGGGGRPKVPQLQFGAAKPSVVIKGGGWRRLQREKTTGFLANATSTHIQGPMDASYNTMPELRVVGLVDPEQDIAFDYECSIKESAPTGGDSLFVKDMLRDTIRIMEIESGRRTREDYMVGGGAYTQIALQAGLLPGPGGTIPSAGNPSESLALSAQGLSSEERMLLEDTKGEDLDILYVSNEKMLTCARNGNLEGCVEAMDFHDAEVDCEDEHGNTPLLLAAQQGAKPLMKELLRRAANINHQNHSGCTVLHYTFEYKHKALFEYLLQKGADDSLLNKEGLTCYEGLHSEQVAEI